jgi:hypothetical protein
MPVICLPMNPIQTDKIERRLSLMKVKKTKQQLKEMKKLLRHSKKIGNELLQRENNLERPFAVIMEDKENNIFDLNIEVIYAVSGDAAIAKLREGNPNASWDDYEEGGIRAKEILPRSGPQEIYNVVLFMREGEE